MQSSLIYGRSVDLHAKSQTSLGINPKRPEKGGLRRMKLILMVLALATVVAAVSALYALPALATPNDLPLDSCQRAVGNAPLVEVVGTRLGGDPVDFCLLNHPAPASGITV